MERVPKVSETTYTRIDADRVKRRRVVEDEIILRGSAASLENQIKQAIERGETLQSEHDACIACGCAPCLARAEEHSSEMGIASDTEIDLRAEWKRATGKEFPNA